jgi:hypothetical protein
MFENLLKLVQENAGDAIINNPSIPNEHNHAAIQTASSGIFDHLKNMASNGGLENVVSMFNSGKVDTNALSGLSNNVAGNLMEKFGINGEQAGSIVQNLIPKVMGQLVNKTNDPQDNSFDLQGIIGAIGGAEGGLGGVMNNLKGLF